MCWLARKLRPSNGYTQIHAMQKRTETRETLAPVAPNEIMKTKTTTDEREPEWLAHIIERRTKKSIVNWDWWPKYYVSTGGCQRQMAYNIIHIGTDFISPLMVDYGLFPFFRQSEGQASSPPTRLPKSLCQSGNLVLYLNCISFIFT